MSLSIGWLFGIAVAYLALLFLIAWSADRGLLPRALVHHPLVYSLSLGVYATSWTYYGSVGLADRSGYAFLTIYLGVTGAFLLGPWLLAPIRRLCTEHQLSSIADLLAFRYGGRATGLVVTLFMLVGILPYVSLQISAVTESVQILSREAPPGLLAFAFCALVTVFAILFGARHLAPRERHQGLVVAIAFESAVKLVALLVAGLFVVTHVFESPAALAAWAAARPDMVAELYAPARTALWPTLLLLAFCAAFLLPRQYHMTFVENGDPRHLAVAGWAFPLYLLLLNLPIVPILFAGRHLALPMEADFYVLGMTLALGREWLAVLVFLGGLSASSAMIIVTTLALSNMCVNHLLLPASLGKARKGAGRTDDLYRRLVRGRRLVIAAIILAGYGFYSAVTLDEGLASLGLISFVAAAQLLPGVAGLLVWPRATQTGFLLGLLAGASVWFVLLIGPLVGIDGAALRSALQVRPDVDIWTLSTFCSLALNGTLFVLGSLATRPSREERSAARAALESAAPPLEADALARSVLHYRYALQRGLGNEAAHRELERALAESGVDAAETRTAELRLLHERLERNLTGLVGPTLAREVLRTGHPGERGARGRGDGDGAERRLLELRLEDSRERLRGMTRQLDDLRRYLRDVLRELPIGVCSVAADGRVYLWNSAMERLTGIDPGHARDRRLEELDAPWNDVLAGFARSTESHRVRHRVDAPSRSFTINLHKADIRAELGTGARVDGNVRGRTGTHASDGAAGETNDGAGGEAMPGQVILTEDRTRLDTLEAELAHSERLASIGRLAAGVAHEIGNPLTGIASLAQNLAEDARRGEADDALVGEQTADILGQVARIDRIVRSLLTFSHGESATGEVRVPIRLAASVAEAGRLVRLAPERRDVTLDVDVPENALVVGDANRLVQVFVNLVDNACDASPAGGTVRVHGHVAGDTFVVTVSDDGPGIERDARERVFEPFWTTKPVGRGTGLGLALVHSIVADHDGRVRIGERHPGTDVVVTLPLGCAA